MIRSNSRRVIDEVILRAKDTFVHKSISTETVADNKDVYDVRIILDDSSKHSDSPQVIAFSHAEEAGYYIDIDSHTLEFDEQADEFSAAAIRYLTAIRDGRLHVRPKRLVLGFISVGAKIHEDPK